MKTIVISRAVFDDLLDAAISGMCFAEDAADNDGGTFKPGFLAKESRRMRQRVDAAIAALAEHDASRTL